MKFSNEYAWIIPLCPLVASSFTGLIAFLFPQATRGFRQICASFNIFSLTTAMVVSIVLFSEQFISHSIHRYLWAWIPNSDFCLEIGFLVDPLALIMSLLVTTVGILVMVYSDSYMFHDQGYVRFYAYLSLFTASMSGLVFSPNLIQLYIFWELVGMCSYLLVGFWFTRASAANACQKAFVTNRIGDFGLLLGILGLYWITGSFEISELCDRFVYLEKVGFLNKIFANIIIILLFLGPVAKSAQFPLHVWLPDAMEGPTPISALIHAATMVAAGIFFIARIFHLISNFPLVMYVISWVGGVTALLGATLAISQKDLKRGLAYSTMSQLGYMVLALGIGAYRSALFHLVTHAYSKALLFLGAGSVIHSIEKLVGYSPDRSQNMFLMGGLRKYMPITGTTFLSGTLSLCGIPPLACFWSKDEIITESWLYSPVLGLVTSGTAGLTAFYMFRIHLLTFEGDCRANQTDCIYFNNSHPFLKGICLWGGSDLKLSINQMNQNPASAQDVVEKNALLANLIDPADIQACSNHSLVEPKESSFVMIFTLVALAIPVLSIGLFGVDFSGKIHQGDYLPSEWFIYPPNLSFSNYSFLKEVLVNSMGSLSISLLGIFISTNVYRQVANNQKNYLVSILIKSNFFTTFSQFVQNWSLNRGYIDYYYNIWFVRNIIVLSNFISDFDRRIVDGFVNATGALNFVGGEAIRYGENGRVSFYSFVWIFGLILLIGSIVFFR
uniref:NAD(P)H-quinone oxidoreductase subunit 5, chloroplastic n=1 Tax=Gastoniella chaerophylla TaxID=170708 RepID=A0A3G5CS73_9MONI|nr:NADH-plastoquinone oxidoreductase subunit 5 [Gastoniella chaerophylla]AYW15700.1 NADH-plastoquinone oxidoreductase subunit 5 [Gastoniella chaerophylla]